MGRLMGRFEAVVRKGCFPTRRSAPKGVNALFKARKIHVPDFQDGNAENNRERSNSRPGIPPKTMCVSPSASAVAFARARNASNVSSGAVSHL